MIDTSCVDDWLNGYVIDSVIKVSVHTFMKFHSVTADINKTKDWGLVQNAALVIEIKVLKLVYIC